MILTLHIPDHPAVFHAGLTGRTLTRLTQLSGRDEAIILGSPRVLFTWRLHDGVYEMRGGIGIVGFSAGDTLVRTTNKASTATSPSQRKTLRFTNEVGSKNRNVEIQYMQPDRAKEALIDVRCRGCLESQTCGSGDLQPKTGPLGAFDQAQAVDPPHRSNNFVLQAWRVTALDASQNRCTDPLPALKHRFLHCAQPQARCSLTASDDEADAPAACRHDMPPLLRRPDKRSWQRLVAQPSIFAKAPLIVVRGSTANHEYVMLASAHGNMAPVIFVPALAAPSE
nr:hypothetical protein CFP56_29955 [Quercus suber]